MADNGKLHKVRDYALILLPVAYAVGFFGWSIHQTSRGMGFRALSVPHYLMAALPVVSVSLLGGLFRLYLEQEFAHRRLWPWALDFTAFLLTGWLVFGGMTGFGILAWDWKDIVLWTTVLALAPGLFRGIAMLSTLEGREEGPSWGRRRIRPKTRSSSGMGLFLGDRFEAILPAVIVLIALTTLNGYVVLGEMHQSFGGAAPRAAYLDLDPSLVEPSWQALLFPNGTHLDASVARTVPVEVHHRNSDFILFRTAAEPERGDRLFDLSMDVVKAIVWCGDSCDRWLPPPAANP